MAYIAPVVRSYLSQTTTELSSTNSRQESKSKHQKELGFIEFSVCRDPTIDIVAIHGLDGHREQSWTAEDGTLWLRDLLPNDLPNARILSYGYDADTRSFTQTSTHTIFRHAEAFFERLSQRRHMHPRRPIIFIAHSLGGIILKKALGLGHRDSFKTDRGFRDISTSTLAVLFFGTPHSGANGVQLAEWMGRLLSVYMYTNNQILSELDRDSPELEEIQRYYQSAGEQLSTIFFYEEYETPILGGRTKLIVPRHLAVIQGDDRARVASLHADHSEIVKYRRTNDENYRKVVDYLLELAGKAKVTVDENWIREDGHRSVAKGESPPFQQTTLPKPLVPVSRYYVQRQEIYDFLTEKLLPSTLPEQQPRCVLHGLGGGGKTQAASFWIEKNKEKFSQIVVVDSSSQQQIEEDIETAIRSVGPQYSKATWKDAVAYLSGAKGWLLFFDNADEPDLQLDEYIPNSTDGVVLITTRNRECVAYAQDSHIQVEKMTEREAIDLLHKASGVTPSPNDNSVAIVRELGMWALAITQAGAYISRTQGFNTYLATFQTHRDKLMREASLKGRNYKGSIYTAFDLSFGLLPKNAQELMKICAFLHHSAIPQALFKRSVSSGFRVYTGSKSYSLPDTVLTPIITRFRSAKLLLASFFPFFSPREQNSEAAIISGLEGILGSEWVVFSFQTLIDSIAQGSLMDAFTDSNGECFYNIHPLVQKYIQDLLEEGDQHRYALLASQLLLGAIRPLRVESNIWHQQLSSHVDNLPLEAKLVDIPHASAFAMVYISTGNRNALQPLYEYCYSQFCTLLGPRHPRTVLAMNNLAITLADSGRLEEAEKMGREVLTLQMEILGQRHPDTVSAMHNLAAILADRGQLEEAEKLKREVLTLRMEILGPRHPDTVSAMSNIATTLADRGRLEKAEKLRREVLTLRMEILGPRHPDTVSAMNNLATTLADRGRLKEAEKMGREVLTLQMEILGPRHPDTVSAMHNLATTLAHHGRLEEAEKMVREVLTLRMEILGPRHPDTVLALHNLATTLADRGRLEKAEKLRREVLTLRMEILGPRHPDTVSAMNNLATTLADRGRLKEAEKMGREVLTLQMEILGPRHPDTVSAMHNLATTLAHHGRLEEAEKMVREVLTLRMEILGPRHPDTVSAMSNLATTLLRRGQLEEAEKMVREVLTLRMEILGPRHPDTVSAMNNLAITLADSGRLEETEKMRREVLTLQMEILGPRHPNTVSAMSNLATTLLRCGQLEEAEKMVREVLTLRMEILGQRHPDTVSAMHNLATTLAHHDRLEEAEKMVREVLTLRMEILGPRHPDTVSAMHNLAITLADRGRLKEAEKMVREVLTLRMEILGPRHPDTVSAMESILLGQLEEIEETLQRVLTLLKALT